MVLPNRRVAGLIAALAALVVVTAGCSQKRAPLAEGDLQVAVSEPQVGEGDTQVAVPLPSGFYPLKGHNEPGNDADNYNGYPRYIVSPVDNMIMAYVPSQTIRMGGGIGPDQVPERTVTVNHFYMDLHEVTNLQFAQYWSQVKASGGTLGATAGIPCEYGASTSAYYGWPSERCNYATDAFKAYWVPCVNDSHPARNVNWWEAWSYSQWANKVLPTEAQWEAAARGRDGRIYPWGNEPQIVTNRYVANTATGRANYDGYENTAPVLSYASGVSPFGIYQMSGNVWEWTADWYDLARYAWPSDEDPPASLTRGAKPFGDRNYPNPGAKDIREARVGPVRGDQRAIRGGSFANPIEQCRVDTRDSLGPWVHRNNVGFRTILPLPPETGTPVNAQAETAETEPAR